MDDNELVAGLALLERCAKHSVPHLMHEIVDELCGRKGPTYENYKDHWNLNEWSRMVKDLKCLVRHVMQGNELDVNLPFAQQIQTLISIREDDLRCHLLEETCAVSDTMLKDFDWKVKLVIASDAMATLKEPLFALDLELKDNKDSKVVSLELTKEELLKVISSFESAQKAVMSLKT